mgnify:CR=1 FL=1
MHIDLPAEQQTFFGPIWTPINSGSPGILARIIRGPGAMRRSVRVAEFARIRGKCLPSPEFWRIRLRPHE